MAQNKIKTELFFFVKHFPMKIYVSEILMMVLLCNSFLSIGQKKQQDSMPVLRPYSTDTTTIVKPEENSNMPIVKPEDLSESTPSKDSLVERRKKRQKKIK